MRKSNKILVTGGAGYIGSHTVIELFAKGYEVIIIDDLSNSKPFVLDRIEEISGTKPTFYKFNLLDENMLEQVFLAHSEIVGVIHFAALKAVDESVKTPLLYYRNNLVSMINLLEVMERYSISNFVFSSSCTVYGQPDNLPVTEIMPFKTAESPYGYTKQINEQLLRDAIIANSQLKGIALRYFNPIGAHQSGLLGELPLGIPNNLMPFITQTAAGIREKLSVFGSNYNTPDGTCIRDFIHVVDLAQAHIYALERLIENKTQTAFDVFNIGTGKGFSVLEVIESFEKVSGLKLNYRLTDRRSGDIEKIYANTQKATNELGWSAQRTLDEMTASAWKWQQSLENN